jgi:hypothetical protein
MNFNPGQKRGICEIRAPPPKKIIENYRIGSDLDWECEKVAHNEAPPYTICVRFMPLID